MDRHRQIYLHYVCDAFAFAKRDGKLCTILSPIFLTAFFFIAGYVYNCCNVIPFSDSSNGN
jgi:hypothetical protein